MPGAFELPLGAMALARTRRYACVLALGCVIRGDTPHFDFIAAEAASGLQLAALETGIPVALRRPHLRHPRAGRGAGRRRAGQQGRRGRARRRSRWPTSSAGSAPTRVSQPRSQLYSSADVQGLRSLWEGPVVREQPKPLDGGDEAPLQPEPPARAHPRERGRPPELRLRAVPEGREGQEGGLAEARALVGAALAALEASRERIDDLNVYPVPDGDTGTNMTLTVRAVRDALAGSSGDARGDRGSDHPRLSSWAREATRA